MVYELWYHTPRLVLLRKPVQTYKLSALIHIVSKLAWFTAGRVLVRFLQAAIDAEGQDQIATLRAELEFVQ